ncbi:sugar phosphate isomerase/epimerase family protein [Rossellomorea vietnamensis]|nr:TIM barrel protein [Rossellomorea vietnamensis]
MNYCIDPGTVGHDVPLLDFIKLSSIQGFNCVEFGIHEVQEVVNKIGIEKLRDYIDKYKIEMAQFSCGTGIPSNISISQERLSESYSNWKNSCKVARLINCKRGSILVNSSKGDGFSEGVKLSVIELATRLNKICEIAMKYEIHVSVEITDPDLLLQSSKIFELIKFPNMGFIIDTYNLKTLDNTLEFLKKLPKDSVSWVHIADSHLDKNSPTGRVFPFEGELNLKEQIDIILLNNNVKYFSVEVYGVEGLNGGEVKERLERAYTSCKRLFEN